MRGTLPDWSGQFNGTHHPWLGGFEVDMVELVLSCLFIGECDLDNINENRKRIKLGRKREMDNSVIQNGK